MLIRRLQLNDYNLGYLNLLENLTTVGNISYEEWKTRFLEIEINPNIQIWVIDSDNSIVGTGTILIEPKIIHNLGKVAHIEDVVISDECRGEGLGKILINHLTNIAKDINCYKITLYCHEENIQFYRKCGFTIIGSQMSLYFD